jgi:hypothetical protein
VADADNNGSFFETRNDHDAIGIGQLSGLNIVPRLRHRIENLSGFPEPGGSVIRAHRSESGSDCQREKVWCFLHKCCPFPAARCTRHSNLTPI